MQADISFIKKPPDLRENVTERSPSPSNLQIIHAVNIFRKLAILDMGLLLTSLKRFNTRYGRGCNLHEKQLKIRSPSPRPEGHHT